MTNRWLDEVRAGFETAYIDGTVVSSLEYRPQFVSNNYKSGKKVIQTIEEELSKCDEFCISVAFITKSGITPLLMSLSNLEKRGVKGRILTTNYLYFTDPSAIKKINELSNVELKMYDVDDSGRGFHTKGYIFKKEEIYNVIIGSSNITKDALTSNFEWNTRVVSTEQGEVVQELLEEFNDLWSSSYAHDFEEYFSFYKEKYEIIKEQRRIARQEEIVSLDKYKLQPNSMQVGFINNLKKIIASGEERALLISATGTGKTYASAFAMRELGYKRVLFLVHRGQLAKQTKKSYERVFDKKTAMGLVGSGNHDYDADYVFATVQTLSRDEHLHHYDPEDFDCIIMDEAHHSSANTYQKVMGYFKPKLWLGMTATPDKRDDNIEGRNIYELFNYQIAYEIRLQQAMEEDMLCPFNYFGISDLSIINDQIKTDEINQEDFNLLTGDERVRHIIEQANYYGYSGDRVKGLVFCRTIQESIALSKKFNNLLNPETGRNYRTIELDGNSSEEERQNAFERLAMNEDDTTFDSEPLDYIFSVEILNEGVDIVEVNQVIMLRPTQSPIVFIQQLGRGLRKAEGKEYVVVLDFIGNYNNNFMIPIALSGDRTYNPDTIRKYVISGNSTIPGASTIHFDEIAKEKIFRSIDRIRGIKSIIRESYITLKNRLGRVPYLMDFYENGEVDPLVIIREYKTYHDFLINVDRDDYQGVITDQEKLSLEYLSKTILSGVRPYELEILKRLFKSDKVSFDDLLDELQHTYLSSCDRESLENAIRVLEGKFVSKSEEYEKYKGIGILESHDERFIHRMKSYAERLKHLDFYHQIEDIINVGLSRYKEKYEANREKESPFVLYEKYSRRDVSLLMNCGRDLSSTMYGMKRIGDDVFIFVTYHKIGSDSNDKQYAEGKPDYADAFVDSMTFRWDSQIGKGPDSSYMEDVTSATRKHLLVKKSDAESSFYYMGTSDIASIKGDKKKDNKGKLKDITKVVFKLHHAVREDLLMYLESNLLEEAV